MATPEQRGQHTVVISHLSERQIEKPSDFSAALPSDFGLVGDGEDQLTIVFGDVWSGEDEMSDWWAAIFPQLRNPDEVAEALRDWDTEDLVMASFPGRAWNLYRFRMAVPLKSDGGVMEEWVHGSVVVLGRALLVFWFRDREEDIRVASGIDARSRRGRYTGEPPENPVSDLASSYVAEAARAIAECAREEIKEVEEWEERLFDPESDYEQLDRGRGGLAQLAALRRAAVYLRQGVDEISEQINPGQFRAIWSTEGFERVAEFVDEELDKARGIVERLRSNVADAFEAANTVAIVRQLEASQQRQERADRLEGTVTRLTAFLLVPALIAAIFGANVQLPATGWARTGIMAGAMIVGAITTLTVLRRWDRHS